MLATLMSGFENCSHEQIRAALPYLSAEEKSDLAEALEAKERDELDARCAQKVSSFDAGPLYWAHKWTKTENPKYREMGLPFKGPFPRKSYFLPLFEIFIKSARLLIPKSRDLVTSWSAIVWGAYLAQWHSAFVIVQSMKDTKAQELVEYAAILYREQPDFLKARHPLDGQTKNEIHWGKGGRIMGVPAGEHQIRTFHPSCYIVDEIAFIPEAQECWNTVHAAGTPQMIGISSAGPGWMAEMCEGHAYSAPSLPSAPHPDPIPPEEAEPIKPEPTYDELCQQILTRDSQKEFFSKRRRGEI